jgi:transposase InsO family protein
MSKTVKDFVRTCDYCQRSKGSNQPRKGLLNPIAIPQERWEVVTMDFVTGLPKTKQGFDMIMTVVDKLSKRVHFIPAKTTADALVIAELFLNNVFRHHGLPVAIISDRDPKFTSKFWQHLMKQLGTRMAISTANHPQTDGQTERMNRMLEDMLRCLVNYEQDNWDKLLPLVEFAYNNQVNLSTKETPFYVDTGRHPRLPQDLLCDAARLQSQNETVNELVKRMQHITHLMRDHLQHAQERQEAYYNAGRQDIQFEVGEQV